MSPWCSPTEVIHLCESVTTRTGAQRDSLLFFFLFFLFIYLFFSHFFEIRPVDSSVTLMQFSSLDRRMCLVFSMIWAGSGRVTLKLKLVPLFRVHMLSHTRCKSKWAQRNTLIKQAANQADYCCCRRPLPTVRAQNTQSADAFLRYTGFHSVSMVKLHLAASLSRSWYCPCWLWIEQSQGVTPDLLQLWLSYSQYNCAKS